MGLDMFLMKKYQIGAQYDWNNVTGVFEIFKNGVKIPLELKHVEFVVSEAIYWRKVNMIHRWFVEHIQDGVDDCKPYNVDRTQLNELIETCKTVLEHHGLAEELLPTQEGYFFGDNEYAESYFECLESSVKQLN